METVQRVFLPRRHVGLRLLSLIVLVGWSVPHVVLEVATSRSSTWRGRTLLLHVALLPPELVLHLVVLQPPSLRYLTVREFVLPVRLFAGSTGRSAEQQRVYGEPLIVVAVLLLLVVLVAVPFR